MMGIIYATNSGMVRRIISPDSDQILNHPSLLGPGESILKVAKGAFTNLSQAESLVSQAIGKPVVNFRCALVPLDGSVKGFISADPTIDSHPTFALIASPPSIDMTCTYDAVSKNFTIPGKVIPAGIDKDGNPIPMQIIPPQIVPAIDPVVAIGGIPKVVVA